MSSRGFSQICNLIGDRFIAGNDFDSERLNRLPNFAGGRASLGQFARDFGDVDRARARFVQELFDLSEAWLFH